MKDTKYILRRVVSGVLIGCILMTIRSCNVHAEQLTPSNIYSYQGTTNSTYTGNYLQTVTKNAISYTGPIIPANRNFDSIRFRYQNVTFATNSNLRQLSFTGQSGVGIPVVYIQNGTRLYGCYVNTDIYNDTDANNVEHVYVGDMFSVICPNVDLSGTDISIWYKYSGIGRTSQISDILISKNFSIAVMSNNSDVVNAINSQTNQSHQDSENINNSINSTTTPSGTDTSNAYSGFENNLATNGVITQLIVLPVSLFTNVLNGLNSTCTRFDLGTLMGTHIYFDCINVSNYFGTQLWGVIDILMSGFFVWYIARKLIKVFENLSSMKEGDPIGD